MRRNFRTKLRKLFDVKNDYDSLEKVVNFLMTDQYVDKFSNMCAVLDHVLENNSEKENVDDLVRFL